LTDEEITELLFGDLDEWVSEEEVEKKWKWRNFCSLKQMDGSIFTLQNLA
jgi:hypothetical protein